MFDWLLLSKNQKLIKKWKLEHKEIIILTHKIIAEYSKNHHKKAKKLLVKLNNIAIDHVIDEDIEFYHLLKEEESLDATDKASIHEFTKTFKETKLTLMNFLSNYSRAETALDDTFFKTINTIADVLRERIDFEEKNLYALLDISKEAEKWKQIKKGLA